MADYSVTAANVQQSSAAIVSSGTAGETITAGQILYKDASDSNHLKLADCTDAEKYDAVGIAVNGAADGQPCDYVARDEGLDPGTTGLVGDLALLSTAGGIMPQGDLATGDYTVLVGIWDTTSTINVQIGKYTRNDATRA